MCFGCPGKRMLRLVATESPAGRVRRRNESRFHPDNPWEFPRCFSDWQPFHADATRAIRFAARAGSRSAQDFYVSCGRKKHVLCHVWLEYESIAERDACATVLVICVENLRAGRLRSNTKRAGPRPRLLSCNCGRRLLGCRSRRFFFHFLDQRGALADALAQVGELGAADIAVALDFDLVHAR